MSDVDELAAVPTRDDYLQRFGAPAEVTAEVRQGRVHCRVSAETRGDIPEDARRRLVETAHSRSLDVGTNL